MRFVPEERDLGAHLELLPKKPEQEAIPLAS